MKEINENELKQLKSEGKKILLDLHGLWCGPCKILIPKLENISTEYNEIEFVKMDVDKNQDFAMSLGVRSIPTVIIYDGENEIFRETGVQTEETYKKILNNL